MKLYTKKQFNQLVKNGQDMDFDHFPVVKLFTPDAQCTWLLSLVRDDNPTVAFGLCDLGMGEPELGYVSLSELGHVRGRLGLPIERDLCFEAQFPLSFYATLARKARYIVTNASDIASFS